MYRKKGKNPRASAGLTRRRQQFYCFLYLHVKCAASSTSCAVPFDSFTPNHPTWSLLHTLEAAELVGWSSSRIQFDLTVLAFAIRQPPRQQGPIASSRVLERIDIVLVQQTVEWSVSIWILGTGRHVATLDQLISFPSKILPTVSSCQPNALDASDKKDCHIDRVSLKVNVTWQFHKLWGENPPCRFYQSNNCAPGPYLILHYGILLIHSISFVAFSWCNRPLKYF